MLALVARNDHKEHRMSKGGSIYDCGFCVDKGWFGGKLVFEEYLGNSK